MLAYKILCLQESFIIKQILVVRDTQIFKRNGCRRGKDTESINLHYEKCGNAFKN